MISVGVAANEAAIPPKLEGGAGSRAGTMSPVVLVWVGESMVTIAQGKWHTAQERKTRSSLW